MLVFPGYVEVFSLSPTVVSSNEILDDFRQVVLLGRFNPSVTCPMTTCVPLVTEILVRIDTARLVFGKECRILHFADVMV